MLLGSLGVAVVFGGSRSIKLRMTGPEKDWIPGEWFGKEPPIDRPTKA